MKKIQILGAGCAKCQKLTEATKTVADTLGIEYTLEKVTAIQEIMKYNVMITPALVMDGVVKVAGRIPSAAEITAWLTTPSENAPPR